MHIRTYKSVYGTHLDPFACTYKECIADTDSLAKLYHPLWDTVREA